MEAGSGSETVTLTFAGDVYLSDHVLNAYEKGGIDGVLGESLRQAAEESDLFMVNQEFPFSARGTPAPVSYTHLDVYKRQESCLSASLMQW